MAMAGLSWETQLAEVELSRRTCMPVAHTSCFDTPHQPARQPAFHRNNRQSQTW